MPNLPKDYSASAVEKMLKQHNCPVPFHVVRTRFLGNIATPSPSVKPVEMVTGLWGGELPGVDSIETLNKILEMLIMGLWNDLARHQKRTAPFRLLRFDHSESREALARIAEIRTQELDGFADGLLGPDDDLNLPSRAAEAMDHLGEIRALFAGMHQLAGERPH